MEASAIDVVTPAITFPSSVRPAKSWRTAANQRCLTLVLTALIGSWFGHSGEAQEATQSPLPTADSVQSTSTPPPLRHARLVVANQTPFTALIAVHVLLDPQTSRTDGWFTLIPGEMKTFEYDFTLEPRFELYGESRDAGSIRWVHRKTNPQATLYFQGPDDRKTAHLVSDDSISFEETPATLLKPPTGTKLVSFVPITVTADGQAFYSLQDPLLPDLTDGNGVVASDQEELKSVAVRVRALARSIARQRRFHAQFPRPQDVPYLLGARVKDRNGRTEIGVVVTSATPKTIFGDDTLLRKGDIIIGLSGRTGEIEPVYSYEDLASLLYDHATDFTKGIAVPVKIKLIRGNEEITGITPYQFNLSCAKCWPAGELTVLHALLVAAFNAWTLGNGAWVEAAVTNAYRFAMNQPIDDLAREHFVLVQRAVRLKQFAPHATSLGEIVAFYSFLPSAPRFIVGRMLARTVLMDGATAVLTNVALDTTESSVWMVLNRSSLYSAAEMRTQARQSLARNAGMSVGQTVIFGAWNRYQHFNVVRKGYKSHE